MGRGSEWAQFDAEELQEVKKKMIEHLWLADVAGHS
jgi:hypothetical protein